MLVEIIFLPNKRHQLTERNHQLRREIKNFKLKDSVLDPRRDTAAELMALEGMEKEIKFNEHLKKTLVANYLLSLIGLRPKLKYYGVRSNN